jgi:hypothetical protein
MAVEQVLGVAAGVLLVFVLPGLALSKAIFPERRVRGPRAIERGVELAAMSLVLSVALTVVAGFALANAPGPGFAAAWSNPLLEVVLAAFTAVALAAAFARGAFDRVPPEAPVPEAAPGADDGWETLSALERLAADERHLRRALRRSRPESAEANRLRQELDAVIRRREEVERAREAEYASG